MERAAAVVRGHLPPTPLRRSFAAADRPGQTWLKLECWQPTGSFKVRGALNNMATLDESARRRGVVAASAGNHALGVAFAGSALGGFEYLYVIPDTTSSGHWGNAGAITFDGTNTTIDVFRGWWGTPVYSHPIGNKIWRVMRSSDPHFIRAPSYLKSWVQGSFAAPFFRLASRSSPRGR